MNANNREQHYPQITQIAQIEKLGWMCGGGIPNPLTFLAVLLNSPIP